MTKNIIVLAIGILLFNYCYSQENDTVTYKRLVKFPALTFDNYNNSSSGFKTNNKNASVGTNEFITQLSFAIPVNEYITSNRPLYHSQMSHRERAVNLT